MGISLWVNDVVSCVHGVDNQNAMLQRINTIAKNYNLEWGQEKFKKLKKSEHMSENMRIRRIQRVAEMEITNCT